MKRVVKGFWVVYHYRASDDARFVPYTRPDRELETMARCLEDAENFAENHAQDYGYGSSSVYRATLRLEGRALRKLPKPKPTKTKEK